MESKYNIENFERFLREKTDEFRLHPSRRVWYSIYNNMHPGNRLPSVSMCIVLIFSLLMVGYLNTGISKQITVKNARSEVSKSIDKLNALHADATLKKVAAVQKVAAKKTSSLNIVSAVHIFSNRYFPSTDHLVVNRDHGSRKNIDARVSANTLINYDKALPLSNEIFFAGNAFPFNNATAKNIDADRDYFVIAVNPGVFAPQNANVLQHHNNGIGTKDDQIINEQQNTTTGTPVQKITDTKINDVITAVTAIKNQAINKKLSENDKAWIEEYALYNKPAPKKSAGKVSWQAYITPSIVYRKLHNNTKGTYVASGVATSNNNDDIDKAVTHKPSYGIGAGWVLQYNLIKSLKLKAGVQLNYTRYNAHGFENYHPIATTITMNSENNEAVFEAFRTTPFTNRYGLSPVKLHNETYQVSLPLGADFRLASLENIEWYVGASVQPTFVVYANSFLISSDRRNYVKDRSMLHRFNLNTGLETYLSIKRGNYNLQVGPEFRSQIFSTNSKLYSIEERLLSYGFKIGVSKKL
jgi:hypothetical protein